MTEQPVASDIAGRNEILASLTAPGAPFEVTRADVNGQSLLTYRNAPQILSDLYAIGRGFADREFLIEEGRRTTYAEFYAQVDALAAWLAGPGGVKQGDRVAIAMRNSAAWMVSFAAITQMGGIAVLINSRGAGSDMKAALDGLAPVLTILDERRRVALLEAGFSGRMLQAESDWQAAVDLKLAWGGPERAIQPKDPCCVLFTSGTSGQAKGAVLSHRSLLTGMVNGQLGGALLVERMARKYGVTAEQIMANVPTPTNMLVFPLFHVSGLSSVFMGSTMLGGKIVIVQRWRPDDALRIVAEERITSLSGVPTMMWDVLNRVDTAGVDLSSLGTISIGGQATPLNLLEALKARFPTVAIGTGYGMTETCGGITLAIGDDFLCRPQSSGFLLPTADVRIVDEDGTVLPLGSKGEIEVRSATVMDGYWNLPEETQAVLQDGWLKTGDVGYLDEDQYIYIVDRKKDMIISSGENIYCAEVERTISQMPEVVEVITFGLPDERLGEKLVAVITQRPDAALDADGVRAFVAANLAAYKAPVDVHIGTELLPRNVTGKIEKRLIRQGMLNS